MRKLILMSLVNDTDTIFYFHQWMNVDTEVMAIIECEKGFVTTAPFHDVKFVGGLNNE